MDTVTSSSTKKSPSSGGLWKRQSSLASGGGGDENVSAAAGDPVESAIDLTLGASDSRDDVPLLSSSDTTANATSTTSNSDIDNPTTMWTHVGLSFAFMMAASSIVPIFASKEDEAWRSQNIPYQTTNAGDVILDLELNQPLVDPPTISCTYGIVRYCTLLYCIKYI